MGVRFQCPNGHKLHIKAELAGKRGICPECGAKFVVPSFSGGRAAADADINPPAAQGGARGEVLASASPQQATPPARRSGVSKSATIERPRAEPPLPVKEATGEPIAWYIRPAGGGQYGPASSEVFQQWIDEGRVAADSWVWRTGWADWKAGSEALALVAEHPPVEPVRAMAAAEASLAPTPAGKTHVEPGSAEARRAELKRRKQKVRKLSAILGFIALAMLVLLVVVLAR